MLAVGDTQFPQDSRKEVNMNANISVNSKPLTASFGGLLTVVSYLLAVLTVIFPSVGHVVQEGSILAAGLVTAGYTHAKVTAVHSNSQNPRA